MASTRALQLSATAIAPLGQVSLATLAWRQYGQVHLTAILKARYLFRHEGLMTESPPPPIQFDDEYFDNDPTRSLRVPSDAVPYRTMSNVWLTGHAYAPPDRPVRASLARLCMIREGTPVIDKLVHLVGSRKSRNEPPVPFETMPLVYERSCGGPGDHRNPVGASISGGSPNILHPDNPDVPVGFGPISPYWVARRARITPLARKSLRKDVMGVPSNFDWDYFQIAPMDQRLDFLRGDEWIVLDGMQPTRMRLQTRLPGVVAQARVLSTSPSYDHDEAFAMVADSVAIDTDDQSCVVTWRGTLPIDGVHVLNNLVVAGGVTPYGSSPIWSQAQGVMVAGREWPEVPLEPDSDLGDTADEIASSTLARTYEEMSVGVIPAPADTHRDMSTTSFRARHTDRDTEAGSPPVPVDELPWTREEPNEPEAALRPNVVRRTASAPLAPPPSTLETTSIVTSSQSPSPRSSAEGISSQLAADGPPLPINQKRYAQSLRDAGMDEEIIQYILASDPSDNS